MIDRPFIDKVSAFVDYVFGGEHHLSRLEFKNNHAVAIPHGSLATFDGHALTRVVLASHWLGLRADVDNHGMRGVKILLHNRTAREGRLWERHPALDDLIAMARELSEKS